jgi:hypothetical protein
MVDLPLLGIGDGSVKGEAAAKLSSHRHEIILADSVSRRELKALVLNRIEGRLMALMKRYSRGSRVVEGLSLVKVVVLTVNPARDQVRARSSTLALEIRHGHTVTFSFYL